ncbi:MAG: SDR family NAD(P)-dependent oxidoreductase [Candidatus Nanopelagicales bacterium]
MDKQRHAGTTALVTGAGSGIGRATVLRLVAEGARVVGCDVNPDGLAETSRLLDEAGLSFDAVVADITEQADVDAFVARAGERVDLLANVAGIMDHFAPLDEVTDELWAKVLAVNLDGPMRLTRAVLPAMRAAGSGAVVMVGSEASLRGGSAGVAYTSSKHGLIGMVQHVAYFYGPAGVRCNAVLPGPVATGIAASATPVAQWALERAVASMGVMGPIAQPDDIATVVSWLGCAEAANVNGAVVAADGGWSAA